MTSKLALVLSAALLIVGCREEGGNIGPVDLAGRDLSGSGRDMAMQLMYTTSNPKDIDTGVVTKGTAVRLNGMVVNTPTSFFESRGNTRCTYELGVQDPDCTAGPCGLLVQMDIPKPAGMSCPFPDRSGTQLATIVQDDTIDITGIVDNFPDMTSSVVEHHIEADSVTKSAMARTITATVISATGTHFLTKTGSDWAMYEGMLVKLQAPAGNLTVTSVDTGAPFHFHTTPGNTSWGTSFRFAYNRMDMGVVVTQGRVFKSVSGVVTTKFGGQVNPTKPTDFENP